MPGGPAYNSGQIHVNDKIVSVQQEGGEPVEVYIPAGTVLEPADKGTQMVVVIQGGRLTLQPKGKGGY